MCLNPGCSLAHLTRSSIDYLTSLLSVYSALQTLFTTSFIKIFHQCNQMIRKVKSCIWWKPGPSHSLCSRLSADLHPIKRLPCFPHSPHLPPPPPSCPTLPLYVCLWTDTLNEKKKSQLSQLPHAVTVILLRPPL